MSIATEIARIQTDKSKIVTKLVDLGLAETGANLDTAATAVDSIAKCGAVSATVQEGDTYTIPKGYHNGSGTVSGVAGGGNYNLQSKQITPTKSQQNVTPDPGYYGLSDVTVGAIPAAYQDVSAVTAVAGDVLANKIIVDSAGKVIAGTMPNNGGASKALTVEEPSYTVPAGYHDGTGTVSITPETKSATPTKSQQVIQPTAGKVLSQVTVEPIPTQFVDTSDATAAPATLLAGETAYVAGEKITGTMANNGATNGTIDGMTTDTYAVPAGYTTGGNVTLTASVEEALAAI